MSNMMRAGNVFWSLQSICPYLHLSTRFFRLEGVLPESVKNACTLQVALTARLGPYENVMALEIVAST